MSESATSPVRVRFAPSPTGFLHVGGARTAIYNELLRLSRGGVFILRIEDTDRERSDEAMTRQIKDALAWIGIRWDEGPFLQSERFGRHRERVDELLAAGKAYRCFCTPQELEELRRVAEAAGSAYQYPGTWRDADPAEVARRVAAGEPFAVRLLMPQEVIRFSDVVRGEVEFPPEALDDYVLLRSDGTPTYHLSVVVDDIDMAITHVIRGEDHLSNTPKHVALFRAFGAAVPTFGHLPLILGQDRKRLSKRFGAASVEEFRDQGILPQALYNYLALLGWSPGDDREILSRDQMGELFTTERLNDSPAIFDPEKLAWMNTQYMASIPFEELLERLTPFLPAVGLTDVDPGRLAELVTLQRSRAHTLKELAESLPVYFREVQPYEPEATEKYRQDPALPGLLEQLAATYRTIEPWTVEALDAALRALTDAHGLKAAALIHPLRMALSASKAGPPVFDLVAVMGRETTQRHLANFLAHLRAAG